MYVDIKCLKKRIGTLTYLIYMIPNVHKFSYLWLCNLQFIVKWIYLGKSSVSKGVSVTEVAWLIRRWLRSITWTDREGKDLFGVLSYHHPTAMHASMHVEEIEKCDHHMKMLSQFRYIHHHWKQLVWYGTSQDYRTDYTLQLHTTWHLFVLDK